MLFTTNNELHTIHTRQRLNFQPSADLTKYQTGVYYVGLKIFNTPPPCIKQESDNPKKFESLLKFLCENSFYSLEECDRVYERAQNLGPNMAASATAIRDSVLSVSV